ncbi:MAG: GAF domain-containing protein, partial [Chloroflexi bacterium]|nr:GAF domain-containing protein [Chloroflexota bacterium]
SSLAESLDLRICFVALVTPGSDHATVAATFVSNRSPQLLLNDIPVQLGNDHIAGVAVKEGRPTIAESPDDPRLSEVDRRNMLQAGCSRAMVVPIVTDGHVTALITLGWGEGRRISLAERRIAEVLAGYLGLVIQRARLYQTDLERYSWLQFLLDNVPGGVYVLDSERRIRWLNRAAQDVAGQSLPEGAHCYEHVEIVDVEGNSICRDRCPALECFKRRGSVYTPNVYLVRPDGQRVPVSKSDTFVVLPSGEERVVGLITDLSHQRAVDDLRDSFVAIVSHEFRTPLHHIKGFATSLLRQDVDWDADTRREFLEGIDRETDRLAVLVSNLLDLSRLEAGHKIYSHKALHDPLAIARQALWRVIPLLQLNPVISRFPTRAKAIWADADELERVLINLMENAAKFSRPGQPIAMEVKNRRDGVEFHVRDRGRGISSEEQAGLFQKFNRTGSAAGVRGAGLGLAICKAFVERHGGRIWLERSTPGRGSDFAFWIPRAGANPQPEE